MPVPQKITNYFIPPHPSLRLFIDNYILCTSNGEVINFSSSWPASNETSLVFFLAGKPVLNAHVNQYAGSVIENHSCLIGMLTRYNGFLDFTGKYNTFMIQFKANGFNKLFTMPVFEIVNRIFSAEEVFGKLASVLHERLLNAKDIQQMASFADNFLLSFLYLQKVKADMQDGITAVSQQLYNTTQLHTVAQYAYKANMSVRNFERRFNEQVGVSPKLYSRLVRFNETVKNKLMYPEKSWTSISHECGYYDQMHMIKDFKQFANINPSTFLQQQCCSTRPRIDIAQPDTPAFNQLNTTLPEEEFVFVQRASL